MTNRAKEILNESVRKMASNYENSEVLMLSSEGELPDRNTIIEIIGDLRSVMFPGYFDGKFSAGANPEYYIGHRLTEIYDKLYSQILLAFSYRNGGKNSKEEIENRAETVCNGFFGEIPEIQKKLFGDVDAGFNGDPAAKSREEIICSYPGFFAIFVYRIAHPLYRSGVPFIPRIMTEYAHGETGIDINSGAEIGDYFFIDHGTGVVVGETTVIGDNVKLYQGVTLGALSTRSGQKLAGKKRHPTVEDGVTIYANATILGGNTEIGKRSVVGGNTFITSSVEEDIKVSAKTQELNFKKGNGFD